MSGVICFKFLNLHSVIYFSFCHIWISSNFPSIEKIYLFFFYLNLHFVNLLSLFCISFCYFWISSNLPYIDKIYLFVYLILFCFFVIFLWPSDLDLVVFENRVIARLKSLDSGLEVESSDLWFWLTRVTNLHKSPDILVDRPKL